MSKDNDDVALMKVLNKALLAQKRRLQSALVGMIQQHCYRVDDESYDSGCISANAEAMAVLVDDGVAEVVDGGFGRAITIRIIDAEVTD